MFFISTTHHEFWLKTLFYFHKSDAAVELFSIFLSKPIA